MSPLYSQITPADDWYYVAEVTKTNPSIIVWKLAVWSIVASSGMVIGLVAVPGEKDDEAGRLIPIPPIKGCYKHLNELSQAEQRALASQKK